MSAKHRALKVIHALSANSRGQSECHKEPSSVEKT